MTFTKYTNTPVFGNQETETVFDGYVWIDNGRRSGEEYIGYACYGSRELFPVK